MRVPVLTQPRVAERAAPGLSPNLRSPDYSAAIGAAAVGRGVSAAAQSMGQAFDQSEAAAKKARQEAQSLAEADALLELQERAQRRLAGGSGSRSRIDDAFDGIDTSKGGFLATRGMGASEASASVVDALDADTREVAERFSDPAQRERFRVRAREQSLAYRAKVEAHVSRELEAARVETSKARQQQALGLAEAGIPDFETWHALSRQVEQDIRGAARTPEAGEAEVALYQSTAAAALTRGLVAQGRLEAATQYVEKNRAILGGRYTEAKREVDRATAGLAKERQASEVTKLVDATAGALMAEGAEYVTEAELRKALPVEGYEGEVRELVERELQQRVVLEDRRLKRDVQAARDDVNRADLQGGKAGKAEDFLTRYDPDFLLARQARRRAEFRQWQASKSSDARERAAAAKAQREIDLQFRYRLEAALTADPTANPAEVAQAFIAERAKEGDEVTVSDTELERGGAASAKAQKRAGTDEGAREKAAAARFEKTLATISKPGKGKPVDQRLLNERVGKAMSFFRERTEAKGKPLDESELAAIEAELVTEREVEVPRRFLPGTTTTKVRAVDTLPAETPAAPRALAPKQQEALDWARANPNDPRAAAILRKLGQQPR